MYVCLGCTQVSVSFALLHCHPGRFRYAGTQALRLRPTWEFGISEVDDREVVQYNEVDAELPPSRIVTTSNYSYHLGDSAFDGAPMDDAAAALEAHDDDGSQGLAGSEDAQENASPSNSEVPGSRVSSIDLPEPLGDDGSVAVALGDAEPEVDDSSNDVAAALDDDGSLDVVAKRKPMPVARAKFVAKPMPALPTHTESDYVRRPAIVAELRTQSQYVSRPKFPAPPSGPPPAHILLAQSGDVSASVDIVN